MGGNPLFTTQIGGVLDVYQLTPRNGGGAGGRSHAHQEGFIGTDRHVITPLSFINGIVIVTVLFDNT